MFLFVLFLSYIISTEVLGNPARVDVKDGSIVPNSKSTKLDDARTKRYLLQDLSTSSTPTVNYNCTPLVAPANADIVCVAGSPFYWCEATCYPGYMFPNGHTVDRRECDYMYNAWFDPPGKNIPNCINARPTLAPTALHIDIPPFPVDASSTLAPTTLHIDSWLLMLKGVASVPSPDLFHLWRSNQTLNSNVPLASHLTTEYFGHFKPDFSNHWTDYCIDQVKVSIYKHGVEKAYITFDAQGSDKMSWFSANRITGSSWWDLQTAPKELVSIAGDSHLGREFYVSGHTASSNVCDSFGWMMISTKSTCNYEKGDRKPSFYYASGTTQAHWGYNIPSSGDVFAVRAHAHCAPTHI